MHLSFKGSFPFQDKMNPSVHALSSQFANNMTSSTNALEQQINQYEMTYYNNLKAFAQPADIVLICCVIHTGCLKKKYPLLTRNRNEAIRYHYSPSS